MNRTTRRKVMKIATEAVSDLFTNGCGTVADRLVFTSCEGADLGGWGRGSLFDRIYQACLASAEAAEAAGGES